MRHFILALATLGAAPLASAKTFSLQPDSSAVTFLAKGTPGFLKIEGTGGKATGQLTETNGTWTGDLSVQLAAFKTGIDLRDEHMHEKYLETAKFPAAKLDLTKVSRDGKDCDFKGSLTLKGTTKPVSGTCEISHEDANSLAGEASFVFNLADFPVGVPSYLGVTVAKEVTITTSFQAKLAH